MGLWQKISSQQIKQLYDTKGTEYKNKITQINGTLVKFVLKC